MDLLPNAESIRARLAEADERLADPAIFGDSRKAAEAAREHQRLSRLLAYVEELASLQKQVEESRKLAADSEEDEEIRALAESDLPSLEERIEELRGEALLLLVPADPSDSRNTILEIRAGAGGDEAALFAAHLHRMYTRYAERQGWRCEPISASPSEGGGFKEVIFAIAGEDAYRRLKFESGVHRVQRVPVTEAGGRIHTSTATVAVLPEAEEVDVQIRPEDLEITVSRASGPGGQSVNTTDSAVQILHKPTGMIVHCADERSQLKNRTKAMTVLRSRLLQRKEEEEREKYAAHRRSQVGSGDRSERIRTYNFPQTRLTDHRIQRTTHDLPAVMEGELDELIDELLRADLRERAEAAVALEAGTADSNGPAS